MPRTKEENKKILERRKQEIITCAINVFSVKDIKSATIDDITKKLKISHGLFYHYFKNKEDLIKSIFMYAKDTIIKDLISINETYRGVKFFEKFFTVFINSIQKRENALLIHMLMNLSVEVMKHKEKNPKIITEFDKFHDSVIMLNLKLLNAEGKLLQSIENTSKLLYIILDGMVDLVIENKVTKTVLTTKSILKTFIRSSDI